jgi:phage baseplate assembly protein gpV/phage protein D
MTGAMVTAAATVPGSPVPVVEVRLDGALVPATTRVLSVRVAARFGAPGQCAVSLHEPGGFGSWPAPARLGAPFEVRVAGGGLAEADEPLFTGEVTGVELSRAPDGTTTVCVRGYDLLHRLRKRQSLRVLEEMTVAAVARTLVADLPIEVDGGDGPALARVVQHRQNDLELLVEVAARGGQLVVLDGTALRLTTLDGYGVTVPLVFGSSLFSADVEANTDRVAGKVQANGWEVGGADGVRATASSPRGAPRVGLEVPSASEYYLVEQPVAGFDDANAAAQLALDLRAASAVVLRGTAAGDGRLRPGTQLEVTGIGSTVDGRYAVCQVVHTVDALGFQSSFSTEPPAPPVARSRAAVTLGRVTAVNDPAGRGRVRVVLPAFGDIDVGWLGVVCPGAGRGRGLVALPDSGDTVVVALPHGDPAAAVVLGSLYGAIDPPDPGVDGDAVRRWSLHSADGQSVVIDDAKHSVRLENRDGSFIQLAPDEVRVKAETDLVLDAAGHGITIRGDRVDFEHAAM